MYRDLRFHGHEKAVSVRAHRDNGRKYSSVRISD